jgi:uncharacterized LabA/DUF88 family protein
MRRTIVFIDAGFINKLSKSFGGGRYLKFDILSFSRRLAKKQGLFCSDIYYYLAPPFSSSRSSDLEKLRRERYDKFVKKMRELGVNVCEGRCQRLKESGEFVYRQKGVDVLLAIDLVSLPLKFKVDEVILIASDSDFVPAIRRLREFGVKTVLYAYYNRQRGGDFSWSNDLIKSVDRYAVLCREDFVDG